MPLNPARRVKTYSSQTGVVYQYVFAGQRRARRRWLRQGTEFLFDVSADRRTSFPLAVFLSDRAVRWWQQAYGRPLSSTEQYAAARMRLFRAFDQNAELERQSGSLAVDRSNIEELLAALDIS